jgi:Transposase DDE domain
MLDSDYVDADFLVTARTQYQVDVVGPAFGSYSRQHHTGQGYDLQAFVLDWEAQQARCPQGHTSAHWRPGRDVSGDPVIRIRFDGPTCRACPARPACTTAKGAPRQRQETGDFKVQYALRAGVESSLSQGTRRFDLRQSRYLGLARTHLQQLLTATAMHVVRVIAWLRGEPLGECRRKSGQLCPTSAPSLVTPDGARKRTSNFPHALVGTQFVSWPGGALGPKETSTGPSPFVCRPGVWEERLGHDKSRLRAWVARS